MAGRTQNVGRNERIVRALLTPIVLGVAGWLYLSGLQGPLALAAIGGLIVLTFILGTGALTGTCGIYAALGFDTCSCEGEYSGGDIWG